jgi:hypothetical protein
MTVELYHPACIGVQLQGSAIYPEPRYTDWDAAMIRTFPVYRELTLELRVSAAFGQVTGGNTAQFSFKLVF